MVRVIVGLNTIPLRKSERQMQAIVKRAKAFRCLACNPPRKLKPADVLPHLLATHSVAMIQPVEEKQKARKK